jgi:hypothetical protein
MISLNHKSKIFIYKKPKDIKFSYDLLPMLVKAVLKQFPILIREVSNGQCQTNSN